MSAESDYTAQAIAAVRAAAEYEPDFGGWLSHVLQNVARECGGADALVARRSGAWETEHVRQLAAGARNR